MTHKQLITLNLACCTSTDRILNAERALTELYNMQIEGMKVKKAIRRQERFIEHLKNKYHEKSN